jgi:hypothetical protein
MGVLSWGNMVSLRFQETMPPHWNHPAPLTPPARSEKAGAAFRN